MHVEHEHIERLRPTNRTYVLEYLARQLREKGTFLFPDDAARKTMTNADIIRMEKEEGVGGYIFLRGNEIIGHVMRRKTTSKIGPVWVVLSIFVKDTFASYKPDSLQTAIRHFGKVLLEEAWANNVMLIRFSERNEKHQAFLVGEVLYGQLPVYVGVKPHRGGDESLFSLSLNF